LCLLIKGGAHDKGIREEEVLMIERKINNQIENSLELAKETPFTEGNESYKSGFA